MRGDGGGAAVVEIQIICTNKNEVFISRFQIYDLKCTKGRKSGNLKKEVKEEVPTKSELEIKREEKKQFREMINKLIQDKTMDIDTIYKLYGEKINEYKYIT